MVAEEIEVGVVFTEDDRALLEMQRATGDRENASTSSFLRGNTATYVHSTKGIGNTHVLASISTPRSSYLIVDSDASRHVIGNASEFSS
jgi:hypothetical protein